MRAAASLAEPNAATLPSINGLGLGDPFAQILAARFRLHRMPDAIDPSAPVLVAVAKVDEALLDRLPELRLVAVFGAGFDYIDTDALRRRGIQLCNTPGLTDACVADLAFGLLIGVQRRILTADRYVRDGKWTQARFPLAPRFSGRRLGIFGLGRIGAAIARRGLGFDLEIAYHNRGARPDLPYRRFDDLESLAAWSDYLVVACPSTPTTRHRVDADVLRALGPAGILVNIARGAVVDEHALVTALEARSIAGAGLDVFEQEPQVPGRLLALDNVVLTPHVAGGTSETWDACYAGVVANIERFLQTGRPVTPVDLSKLS